MFHSDFVKAGVKKAGKEIVENSTKLITKAGKSVLVKGEEVVEFS